MPSILRHIRLPSVKRFRSEKHLKVPSLPSPVPVTVTLDTLNVEDNDDVITIDHSVTPTKGLPSLPPSPPAEPFGFVPPSRSLDIPSRIAHTNLPSEASSTPSLHSFPTPTPAGSKPQRSLPTPPTKALPALPPIPVPSPDVNHHHPWSIRTLELSLNPISPRRRRATSETHTHSSSLFPRAGHSLSSAGTAAAGLNLFGGMVDEATRKDMYAISVNDFSVSRVYTIGDIPSPRTGHASVFVGSVVAVWGGDTAADRRSNGPVPLDSGLYFLNLVTREWTRAAIEGPSPPGRFGHSAVLVGSKFYVFGGFANGNFYNDLWCFDLTTYSVRSRPCWEQIEVPRSARWPCGRSGQVCVVRDQHIYMYGGTDGMYHYSDVWAFDTAMRTWTELICVGQAPAPREGHAAALSGDILYIHGGRGVSGKPLGDLSALHLTRQRWYVFAEDLGPAPSPRYDHAMVAIGSKLYLVGGDTEDPEEKADVVHVLNTKLIKFPSSRPSVTSRAPSTPPPAPPRAMHAKT